MDRPSRAEQLLPVCEVLFVWLPRRTHEVLLVWLRTISGRGNVPKPPFLSGSIVVSMYTSMHARGSCDSKCVICVFSLNRCRQGPGDRRRNGWRAMKPCPGTSPPAAAQLFVLFILINCTHVGTCCLFAHESRHGLEAHGLGQNSVHSRRSQNI